MSTEQTVKDLNLQARGAVMIDATSAPIEACQVILGMLSRDHAGYATVRLMLAYVRADAASLGVAPMKHWEIVRGIMTQMLAADLSADR